VCRRCRCSNGQFNFCHRVDCPYSAATDTQSCEVAEGMIGHGETYEDDCNTCRCLNGRVSCTKRDCDDDDDDDDDDDNDCEKMPNLPVCATNLRTYPSRCAARANGFAGLEVTPGACSQQACPT